MDTGFNSCDASKKFKFRIRGTQNMKKLIATAVGALLVSGGVNAASVDYFFSNEITQLSDNSAEYLINPDGVNDTTLDIGDRLSGIFNINSTEGLDSGGFNPLTAGNGFDELSGVFDITVTSKVADGAGGWDFVFAPSAAFESTYGLGAMVAFYTDPVFEYSRLNDTIANLTANITDGNLFMVAGFNGGGNEFWTSNAVTDDLAIVGAIPAPNNGGVYNAAVDLLVNNSGRVFNAVNCFDPNSLTLTQVDMCGSGSLLGIGGANTPFDTFNNVDFTMYAVPEPSMLMLFGTGLLAGAGVVRRRRKS